MRKNAYAVCPLILILAVGFLMLPTSTAVAGKTGSLTFTLSGTAPTGSQVRITAVAQNSTTYDKTRDMAGLTAAGICDSVKRELIRDGWLLQAVGTNGILLQGYGTAAPYSPVKKIDASDNKSEITVTVDGHIEWADAQVGQRKFKFTCSDANADATNPGTLQLELNTFTITAALAAGDIPATAAQKLETALIAAGFAVTRSGGEITLDWENATNKTKLGSGTIILDLKFQLTGGAGGPHVAIEMPDTTGVIPTFTEWGLIILALLAVGWVIWTVARRRTAMATA